ncbi:hypothetical protein ACQ86N_12880 [Puia sp. P3]|uniref:hypothetical protein n=1 Tax=Puia sp. P3 TaxID=3423952 RepID=UPI003D674FD5
MMNARNKRIKRHLPAPHLYPGKPVERYHVQAPRQNSDHRDAAADAQQRRQSMPEGQQKEVMGQPAEEKGAGEVDKIEQCEEQSVRIETDKPRQQHRYRRDRNGKDQAGPGIVELQHGAKFTFFPSGPEIAGETAQKSDEAGSPLPLGFCPPRSDSQHRV